MNSIVATIIGVILRSLPDNALRLSVDNFITYLRNHIKNDGKQNWEDTIILPALDLLEKQLGLPVVGIETTTTPQV